MDNFFRYKVDHLLFWVLTVFFHGYTHAGIIGKAGMEQYSAELLIRNLLLGAVIYGNLLFVIPHLIQKGKFLLGSLAVVFSLIAYVLLKNAHDVYLYGWVMQEASRQAYFHNSLYNLSIVIFYLSFATTLHLSKQWYLQREVLRKVEIEKLNTELAYLKAQLNPHFLFNSINTIYFQIEKHNQGARETLARFSDMLRYQLYECNGNEIAIEKEIQYLKNYVELQRLRKDEQYDIQFHCSPELANVTIAPLLLLPFVENAFKHVSHFTNRKNEISIYLHKRETQLELCVANTTENEKPASMAGGVGLKNVKRRLELLYEGKHTLEIVRRENFFEVNLKLEID